MSLIYLPFSYIMKACVWLAQNSYLFGLLFFALVFQVILFPLAIKQQKSQIKMARIRPKEMAIRKSRRYAGRTDRVTQQRMQQEIQEMYQQEGYSPFSGCLPMLIQLPLILILYAIVRYPIQYSSNFTDAAEHQIHTVVAEQGIDIPESEGFAADFSQYAFNYVENIRAHLTDTDAAKEADAILTEKISKLGLLQDPAEGEPQTYANGYRIYTLDRSKNNTYRELGTADIVGNYGEKYIASLQGHGALDAEYDASLYPLYIETNGEKTYYADMMPNFTAFGVNLLLNPSFSNNNTWQDWILLLIPILVFVTSFLNTKIMKHYQPAQLGPDGNPVGGGLFMTVGMPLMSTVFTLMFPAAIGAYWVWRTLLSMVQPVILNKFYPIPVVTDEEIAAAEREMKGKEKKKKLITIEVDEDDDSYADIEVIGKQPVGSSHLEGAKPKQDGSKKPQTDLPYRKPTHIEMLSADDEDEDDAQSNDTKTE